MATKPNQKVLFEIGQNENVSLVIRKDEHTRKTWNVQGPCQIIAQEVVRVSPVSSPDTSDGGASLKSEPAVRQDNGKISSGSAPTTITQYTHAENQVIDATKDDAESTRAMQASQNGTSTNVDPDPNIASLHPQSNALARPKPSPLAAAVIARMEKYLGITSPATIPTNNQATLTNPSRSFAMNPRAEVYQRPVPSTTGGVNNGKFVPKENIGMARRPANVQNTAAPIKEQGYDSAPTTQRSATNTSVEANARASFPAAGTTMGLQEATKTSNMIENNAVVQNTAASTKLQVSDSGKHKTVISNPSQPSAATTRAKANSRANLPDASTTMGHQGAIENSTTIGNNALVQNTAASTKLKVSDSAKNKTTISNASQSSAATTRAEASSHSKLPATIAVNGQRPAFDANTSMAETARARDTSSPTKTQQAPDAGACETTTAPASAPVETQATDASAVQNIESIAWMSLMVTLHLLDYDNDANANAFWQDYLTYQALYSGDGFQQLGLASEKLSIVIGADHHATSRIPTEKQKCLIHNLFYSRREPIRVINLGVVFYDGALTGWILAATAQHSLIFYKMETHLHTFQPGAHTWAPAINDKCGRACVEDKTNCANNWIEDVTVTRAGLVADLVKVGVPFNVREKQRRLGTYGLYFI